MMYGFLIPQAMETAASPLPSMCTCPGIENSRASRAEISVLLSPDLTSIAEGRSSSRDSRGDAISAMNPTPAHRVNCTTSTKATPTTQDTTPIQSQTVLGPALEVLRIRSSVRLSAGKGSPFLPEVTSTKPVSGSSTLTRFSPSSRGTDWASLEPSKRIGLGSRERSQLGRMKAVTGKTSRARNRLTRTR